MSDNLKVEIKCEEDFKSMERMIEKECQRYSLVDLCESWGFDCGAFYHFIQLAHKGFVAESEVSQ